MSCFYLLQNPEVFQGAKILSSNTKCYFEGWYFKHIGKNYNISFIPGVHIENKKKSAFIQIITDSFSYYVSYSYDEFHFSHNPFSITIGNNFFSLDKIKIDISNNNFNIYGELFYKNITKLQKNILNPNIMGPFSFIPFMECNHAILSMKHEIKGFLSINNQAYSFNNGIGYVEKDWGTSFPSSYLWAQANNFLNKDVSFILSIANIPFVKFSFRGFICSVIIDGKEYRFSTYTGAKIISSHVSKDNFNIKLKDNHYTLHIYSNNKDSFVLKAPRCGAMKKDIYESINSQICLTLYKGKTVLFEGSSLNCGLEIV